LSPAITVFYKNVHIAHAVVLVAAFVSAAVLMSLSTKIQGETEPTVS